MKLYGRIGSGSIAVEALLSEIGAGHVVVEVERDQDGKAPDWFLKLNPRGEVPTLELDDGSIMTESVAMMIYLADRFPDAGLAPSLQSPSRGRYLRWLVFMATTIYMSDLRMYYPARYSTDPDHAAGIERQAVVDLMRDYGQLSDGLGKQEFLSGDQFSAADVYAAMLLTWSPDTDELFKTFPNLRRLYAATTSRTKIAPVWERHRLPMLQTP